MKRGGDQQRGGKGAAGGAGGAGDERDADSKRKVAILGAGPAGLAAAFALTRTAEMRARYAVTIYQMGWRAGGKSATGRAMDKGWRIEQNGSHYLFGCYGNSFAMVRQAYEVLEEHGVGGFGDYRGQFVARNLIAAKEDRGNGKWDSWFQFFPETTAWPDRGGKYPPPSHFFFVAVQMLLGAVLGMLLNTQRNGARDAAVLQALFPLGPFHTGAWPRVARALAMVVAWVIDWPLALLARGVGKLLGLAFGLLPPRWRAAAGRAARGVAAAGLRATRAVAKLLDPTAWCGPVLGRFGPIVRWHRARILVELGTSAALGVLGDRLWEAGRLEAIDDVDFRDWLRRHGAGEDVVGCPLIKVWYDAVVAYEDGDEHRPRISAGVTMHAIFRAIVTYKGAFAYQMTNEIGDCFIAPIVRALQLRGVDFQFFHRVRDVVPGAGAAADVVEEIVVDEQIPEDRRRKQRVFVTMDPTGGKRTNESRKVWPNRPVFEDDDYGYEGGRDNDSGERPAAKTRTEVQTDGEAGAAVPEAPEAPPLDSYFANQVVATRRLRRGVDFHDVVFALPYGVARDFPGLRARAAWSEMCEHLKGTSTQSMRLWFTSTMRELGWTAPGPILSGFAYPFSTWEDNGQNCGNECFGKFGPGQEPQAIATLFGPLRTGAVPGTGASPAFAHTSQSLVEKEALRFYERRIGALWPELEGTSPRKFEVLLAPKDDHGEARFAWQYIRANVGPLEAYVLALPGTLGKRMRPDESGFRNMTVAGEWTRNGFEVGCIEGAVIAGLSAAETICHRSFGIVGHEDLTFGPFRRGRASLPRPRRAKTAEHVSA